MAASVRASIQIYNGMTPALKSMQQALNLTISSFERLQVATDDPVNLSAIAAAKSKLADVAVAVNGVEEELREAENQSKKLKNSFYGLSGVNLKGILGGFGAGMLIKEVVGLSDTYAQTYARLNLINDGLQTTGELQTAIYNSAQRSRAAYQDTAAAVSKLGLLAGDSFSSVKEIVAFTELMNKNFKIAGASATEQASAMYQLTQAMASGRLQGDEYRSIIENAPLLASAIEDYMINVQHAEGTMKDWASEGMLTADVIKAALFNTANEVNERFEQIPMTWSDVWTQAKNEIIMALEPVLQFINVLANNWDSIEPYVTWVLSTAAAFGVLTAAISLAKSAHDGLVASLLMNPFMWIAMLIGIVVMITLKWIKSVGGVKVAWLMTKNALLQIIEEIQLKFKTFTINVENAFANLSARVLLNAQNMVNGIIDGLNFLKKAANDILDMSFKMSNHVAFAAEAELEAKVKTEANNAELDNFKRIVAENRSARNLAIRNAQATAAAGADDAGFDYSSIAPDVSSIADNTGSISDSLETSDEYFELLTDLAEREAINRFTTAEVKVDFTTNANISNDMDIDGVFSMFEEKLQESINVSAEGAPV